MCVHVALLQSCFNFTIVAACVQVLPQVELAAHQQIEAAYDPRNMEAWRELFERQEVYFLASPVAARLLVLTCI